MNEIVGISPLGHSLLTIKGVAHRKFSRKPRMEWVQESRYDGKIIFIAKKYLFQSKKWRF